MCGYFGKAKDKVDDVVGYVKENGIKDMKDLRAIFKKEEIEEKEHEKNRKIVWILAIVGLVVLIAAAAFCIYKFFVPDYLEDFDDDFEDFDDDFADDDLTGWDDVEEVEVAPAKADAE